jgi:zinc transport system permease protein
MLELFHYDFIIRAFAAGIITAIIAPMIGMFLVVRRYSLMADTLAHVSLVGVAIGIITNINPAITALITSVIAAIGIERLRQAGKIFGESVLALFLSGGLALSIVLISFAHGLNVNLFSFLFGSITTVTNTDLYLILGIGIIIAAVVISLYKELFFISFNEELAEANGLNTRALNNILIILAAVTVSLSIRIIGVLLIGALMVIPVVSAMQYGYGFFKTFCLSIVFSLLSVIIGLFLSYYLNLASGGTIVVIALILFGLSLLVNVKSKSRV